MELKNKPEIIFLDDEKMNREVFPQVLKTLFTSVILVVKEKIDTAFEYVDHNAEKIAFVTIILVRCRLDWAATSLLCHFELVCYSGVTSNAIRSRFEISSVSSLPFHTCLTSIALQVHFELPSTHVRLPGDRNAVSLRYTSDFISRSLWHDL